MREREREREYNNSPSMSWFENFYSKFFPSWGSLKACPVGVLYVPVPNKSDDFCGGRATLKRETLVAVEIRGVAACWAALARPG